VGEPKESGGGEVWEKSLLTSGGARPSKKVAKVWVCQRTRGGFGVKPGPDTGKCKSNQKKMSTTKGASLLLTKKTGVGGASEKWNRGYGTRRKTVTQRTKKKAVRGRGWGSLEIGKEEKGTGPPRLQLRLGGRKRRNKRRSSFVFKNIGKTKGRRRGPRKGAWGRLAGSGKTPST